jgi:nucleoside-diphosphate-sugar epimerase
MRNRCTRTLSQPSADRRSKVLNRHRGGTVERGRGHVAHSSPGAVTSTSRASTKECKRTPLRLGVHSIGYRKTRLVNITVFGANGLTGRQLVGQALDAGHDVVAVTRRTAEFPLSHVRLTVAEADVHDELAVTRVLETGSDAVLSTLGVPFDKKPIDIYSDGITKITEAMTRHGIKRIVAVSSTAVEPHHHAEGGFLLNRVMQPLVARTIGKTTYADMRAMEAILRETNLAWTVVRSAGLFDADHVSTNYKVSDGPLDGVFTSRADLAALVLAQATDTSHVGKAIEITTSEGAPTLLQMIRREAFGRD